MEDKNVIISERYKPKFQYLFSAVSFAIILLKIFSAFYDSNSIAEGFHSLKNEVSGLVFLFVMGLGLIHKRKTYIDLKKMRIRHTVEIGFMKFGAWQPFKSLEYVSIFPRVKADGYKVFEVNLWYKKNQHVNLYEEASFEDAYRVAFRISDFLKINLLDSTETHKAKWVDMKASKAQGKIIYSE